MTRTDNIIYFAIHRATGEVYRVRDLAPGYVEAAHNSPKSGGYQWQSMTTENYRRDFRPYEPGMRS